LVQSRLVTRAQVSSAGSVKRRCGLHIIDEIKLEDDAVQIHAEWVEVEEVVGWLKDTNPEIDPPKILKDSQVLGMTERDEEAPGAESSRGITIAGSDIDYLAEQRE
jgi:hypothetical protein